MYHYYKAYYHLVLSFLNRLTNDEVLAADLAKKTLAKVLGDCSKIENEQDFLSLLCRAAYQLFLINRNDPDGGSDLANDLPLPEDILYQTFQALSEKRRISMTLHHIQGKTVKEIAQLLNISEQTVRNHLSDSLQKLLEIFSDKGGQTGLLSI